MRQIELNKLRQIKADFNENMTETDLETPDKSEEVETPSFLLFGILNGTSLMFTLVCLGLTIFAQAKGNSDLNVFLWLTFGCSITLCLLELVFCTVGFVAICRKDYTILLACSCLFTACGVIVYFLIGLGYTFCVVMTAFVMEEHINIVKACLLVNLGLGAAKFFILAFTIAMGLMIGTKNTVKELKDNIKQSMESVL